MLYLLLRTMWQTALRDGLARFALESNSDRATRASGKGGNRVARDLPVKIRRFVSLREVLF
jgi:hypothetical protein